ncbi:MAG TPA: universal stress protein [Ktedonobacteraceae bacterium]
MFHRFFVPLDGSPRAEKAIPIAAELARASSGSVILARVIVPPLTGEYGANIIANETHLVEEKDRAEARAYLDEVMERHEQVLAGLHLIVETMAATQPVPAALLSFAEQEHTDLIVMCSRGESSIRRWVFGSVAQNTMRHSPLPVLVLNEHEVDSVLDNPTHPLRILVPLDGSAFSESILQPLSQFLVLFPTREPHELHLLQVVTIPAAGGRFHSGANVTDLLQKDEQSKAERYLQAYAQQISTGILAGANVTVTTEAVVHTDVAETVLKRVQAEATQTGPASTLIALATHGRSGVKRALLGSVTEHVFGATMVPLFIVCPPALERERNHLNSEAQKTPETRVEPGPVGLL